ncbi:hypothetical protein KJI95_06195 [Shewanella sp. JM162201]|uniref:DUF6701 domain-containing protein n=1 Tax=Shewanella jiangmenensis TaxID=2837387 RepID=A0ABS5V0X0_9GAMM|nr:DUF6701 domain-containing protein [Shewanella jiangmenensis]MBT1444114.1 hypothetical protein [Shewanella jiangmenensis]
MLAVLLMLWLPAMAVPLCSDIFTKPPTGNHFPGLLPPANLEPSRGVFECDKHGCNQRQNYTPGDYNFSAGDFKNGNFISTNGASTRLYFNSLSMSQAHINVGGKASDLIIYVRGSFSIAGQNTLNAIVYVAGAVHITGNATLNGAIASGGPLVGGGSSNINIDLSQVDNADFGGMCDDGSNSAIDHFLMRYSASPLTCKAEPVSVYACKDASCSSYETSAITASLTAANAVTGWEGGSQLTLTNGVGSKNLWHTVTAPLVTIGVGSASVAAINPTLCQRGNNTPSVAACTIAFADSGLILDVPDKLAAKSATVTLSAVRKDNQSQRCVPTFQNVSKNIQFWSEYQDPATIFGSPRVSVNNTNVATSASSPTSLPLAFNASGTATLNVNYPDAGKLALNARYIGSASEGNLQLEGSDSFVSFPAGMCVQPVDANAYCASGDETCAAYKKAGDSFGLKLSAHAWVTDNDTNFCDNPTTPNFARQNIMLNHELVAPTLGSSGALGTATYAHQAASSANPSAANTVAQSISEVGVFRFGTAPFSAYLGSNAFTVPAAKSVDTGRFVPASFDLTGVSLTPACSGFSYMDQPTPLAMTIEAKNLNGALTENYQGVFAKGVASLHGENSDNGVDLYARLSPLAGSWSKGIMAFDVNHRFTFGRTTAPLADGPFEALDIGLQLDDGDGGMSKLTGMDMKPDSSGDCTLPSNTCTARRLNTSPLKLYHGRVQLDNTYGPEGAVLRMRAQAQYWQGSAWGALAADSCTLVNPALATQVDDPLLGYRFAPALLGGQSILRSAAPAQFSAGMLDLYWQSQGSPLYRGQVTAPLAVDDWLKWYWNWDGSSPNSLSDPRASAYFGRYRGDDRIIFWREVN